jgi:hypothetical protein
VSNDIPITPITGYRKLNDDEINLANELKALATQVGNEVEYIMSRVDTDKRWCAIAKTDLQKGFMSLIRSVLKPETF